MDFFNEITLLICTGKLTIDDAIRECEGHLALLDQAQNRYFKHHDQYAWSVIDWSKYEGDLRFYIERLQQYKEYHGEPEVPVDLTSLIQAEVKKQLDKKMPNPFGALGENWNED